MVTKAQKRLIIILNQRCISILNRTANRYITPVIQQLYKTIEGIHYSTELYVDIHYYTQPSMTQYYTEP